MDAAAIYETFEAFEGQVAELYFSMSRHFASNVRLSRFWADMAQEELKHRSVLQACREYCLFNGQAIDDESIERIRGLLERTGRAGMRHDLTVAEAFRIALEVESSEIDNLYWALTLSLYSPYPFLREAFHREAGDHFRRFAKAIADFTDDPSLAAACESLTHCPIGYGIPVSPDGA